MKRAFVCVAMLAFLTAVILEFIVSAGYFEHIYNHQPGKCIKFEINGSEDIVLLPNDQALISSGLYFWHLEGVIPKPESGIFMFDLNDPTDGPKKVVFEGDFHQQCPDFTPHGIGHWIDHDGSILLYVINHRREKDTVDSFYYNPDTLSLKHRKSFEAPHLYELNSLVLLGRDEFYATNDHYFQSTLMKNIENILRLPLSSVVYYNGNTEETKVVANGLKYANGIAMSNNGKFVYVSNLLKGEIVAYARSKDNMLVKTQETLQVQAAMDNIFVDPENGHLWIAMMPKVLDVADYFTDHTKEVASQVLHVAVDENASSPFFAYQMEEIFATKGDIISATTIGMYHDGKLLIGTIGKDMLYCEVPYLMYPKFNAVTVA